MNSVLNIEADKIRLIRAIADIDNEALLQKVK